MRKKIKLVVLTVTVAAVLFSGCGLFKDDEERHYGDEIGTASGYVNVSKDELNVSISDVKAYVGQDIDFLSLVKIPEDDIYDDMEVWVDASTVDIFTPGDYEATYTFKLLDMEKVYTIAVTIMEDENASNNGGSVEMSASEGEGADDDDSQSQMTDSGDEEGNSDSNNGNNSNNNQSGQNQTSDGNGFGWQGETSDNTSWQGQTSGNTNWQGQTSGDSSWQGQTSSNTSWQGQTSGNTNWQGQTTKTQSPQSTTKKPQQTTTKRREIVTSAGTQTTANKNIGYSSIELLSGKVIQVKSTTSRYIVSTYTDISNLTSGGNRYKVSKLTVVYNDGSKQVLETNKELVKK